MMLLIAIAGGLILLLIALRSIRNLAACRQRMLSKKVLLPDFITYLALGDSQRIKSEYGSVDSLGECQLKTDKPPRPSNFYWYQWVVEIATIVFISAAGLIWLLDVSIEPWVPVVGAMGIQTTKLIAYLWLGVKYGISIEAELESENRQKRMK